MLQLPRVLRTCRITLAKIDYRACRFSQAGQTRVPAPIASFSTRLLCLLLFEKVTRGQNPVRLLLLSQNVRKQPLASLQFIEARGDCLPQFTAGPPFGLEAKIIGPCLSARRLWYASGCWRVAVGSVAIQTRWR